MYWIIGIIVGIIYFTVCLFNLVLFFTKFPLFTGFNPVSSFKEKTYDYNNQKYIMGDPDVGTYAFTVFISLVISGIIIVIWPLFIFSGIVVIIAFKIKKIYNGKIKN